MLPCPCFPTRSSFEQLAEGSEGLVGRDIKNAVIAAAVSAARVNGSAVSQAHLLSTVESIRQSRSEKGPVQADS